MNDKKKHIIIGNSAAALSAIKAIRENDPQADISLVSAEDCYAYSPVLLTYYMAGKISRDQVFLTDPDYYAKTGVRLVLNNRAEEIDVDRSQVILADGQTLGFDRLLIATGSSAKKLGVDGDELPGIFTLKTIADADRILSFTETKKDIAILGGGLIGMQAANALTGTGRRITLIIGSGQPLSQNVDGECSRFITHSIEHSGLSVLFNTRVEHISKDDQRLGLQLSSGESFAVDAAIVGKGVRPNTGLAESAGLEVDWGIVVDSHMNTSVPGIFAAGDVAQGLNQATGDRQVVATWVNACVQGKAAGTNMSGGDLSCSGLNGNVCSVLGNSVASVGITRPDPERHRSRSYTHPSGLFYRNIIFNEADEIAGAIMMGQVADIGLIRNMIVNRVQVPVNMQDRIARGPISYGEVYKCCVDKSG
jgi:NAD(P)H-nitrite reductase large subunit